MNEPSKESMEQTIKLLGGTLINQQAMRNIAKALDSYKQEIRKLKQLTFNAEKKAKNKWNEADLLKSKLAKARVTLEIYAGLTGDASLASKTLKEISE